MYKLPTAISRPPTNNKALKNDNISHKNRENRYPFRVLQGEEQRQ